MQTTITNVKSFISSSDIAAYFASDILIPKGLYEAKDGTGVVVVKVGHRDGIRTVSYVRVGDPFGNVRHANHKMNQAQEFSAKWHAA